MRSVRHQGRIVALGLALAVVLYACVAGPGYVGSGYIGDYYEPYGYDYGGWGPGFFVGPPREREPRIESRPRPGPAAIRLYHPAPAARPMPSIPTAPRSSAASPHGR